GCSVCQDTTISDDASAPNCRCNPATGGVATGSDDWPEGSATSASAVRTRDAATTAAPAMPAAASSLRRLRSRLNVSGSCVVIAMRLLLAQENLKRAYRNLTTVRQTNRLQTHLCLRHLSLGRATRRLPELRGCRLPIKRVIAWTVLLQMREARDS